ncbi:MiaB/RimO family radical SAM methylthiotransferase [candidate division WOR-3 bacterium]|nr:MiaB/RimO family radical SAM methylthiotransferase [candidate division WOR-3 bacterium]
MRVSFETLGCRLNQYDTQLLTEGFKEAGFKIVDHKEKADVRVVNTCIVTSKAARESKNIAKNYSRDSNRPFIIVTGCYAKIGIEEIKAIPGVGIIEPNLNKIALKFLHTSLPMTIKSFEKHIKAFVKIQSGCDQFCSYCIVPYARGTPQSRPLEEIISEIKALIANGYEEFVLTGTNIGKCNLLNIVKAIEKIPGIRRFGFSSIEPPNPSANGLGISDELLEFISESQKFSKYFHIPLQSGDNKILELMGRWYTAEEYEELICKIKEKIPDVAIGADVIVGFPGEGEQEFLNTYNLISQSPISRLHVFRYSKRPRTKALDLIRQPTDEVSEGIKKERSKILRELSKRKWQEFRNQFIDKILEAHIESKPKNGYQVGVTSNYIKVLFKSPFELGNKFVKLKIKDVNNSYSHGQLVI